MALRAGLVAGLRAGIRLGLNPSWITGAYNTLIFADNPVAFYQMDGVAVGIEASNGAPAQGLYTGGVSSTLLPNGDRAAVFDGETGLLQLPDDDVLSVTTTGVLTVEAWFRPDTLTFPNFFSTGYIHWLSKTGSLQNEWTLRMYNEVTTDDPSRPNRISGYAFNAIGSLGAGSYFQDVIVPWKWIHVALVIDIAAGTTRIYRDGVLRDTDLLSEYSIVPSNGTAPVRVGVNLVGAVGKVAFYNYALSAEQQLAHIAAMITVPTDGPDGVYVPNSADHFDQLGIPVPRNLWLCQEASGTVVDSFGVSNLTPLGTGHLYQQSVDGWSRKAIKGTDGASSQRWSNTSTIPNIANTSVLFIGYWQALPATPAGTRRIAVFGTGATGQVTQVLTTPTMRVATAASTVNGVENPCTGLAMPLVLYIDRTNNINCVYTGQEIIPDDFEASLSGVSFHFGANSGTAGDSGLLWGALWTGADAEIGDDGIRERLQRLGWPIPW